MSAPEMLPPTNMVGDARREYNERVDIWTIGCIIFNMFTGMPPFVSEKDKLYELHHDVREGNW